MQKWRFYASIFALSVSPRKPFWQQVDRAAQGSETPVLHAACASQVTGRKLHCHGNRARLDRFLCDKGGPQGLFWGFEGETWRLAVRAGVIPGSDPEGRFYIGKDQFVLRPLSIAYYRVSILILGESFLPLMPADVRVVCACFRKVWSAALRGVRGPSANGRDSRTSLRSVAGPRPLWMTTRSCNAS